MRFDWFSAFVGMVIAAAVATLMFIAVGPAGGIAAVLVPLGIGALGALVAWLRARSKGRREASS